VLRYFFCANSLAASAAREKSKIDPAANLLLNSPSKQYAGGKSLLGRHGQLATSAGEMGGGMVSLAIFFAKRSGPKNGAPSPGCHSAR